MVKSTMTETVLSWGRGGNAAIVGVLNIYDIMLAHDVPVYIATRK